MHPDPGENGHHCLPVVSVKLRTSPHRTAIPSGPCYLGTFELAGVRIAAAFGVGADPALALTVVIHAGSLLQTSAGGAVALVRLGWRTSPFDASARVTATVAESPPRGAR